jgi:DNA-binding NtrC family response regulator/tetratricopeptide (TPR) repeat protein
VVVSSVALLRLPELEPFLTGRHLCVLLDSHGGDDRAALARFLSRLGAESARRHVLLRFTRSESAAAGAQTMDSMGLAAMTSMVFVDRDYGPAPDELFDAARRAGGRPGVLLDQLRATPFDEPMRQLSIVHESSPAYALDEIVVRPSSVRAGRVLRDAADRGAKLAARGRHGSATRLLTRACRVLDARGEREIAAACAEQLGWIERDRGRSAAALESFDRLRRLDDSRDGAVGATIGYAVVCTDECRFQEAEAASRSALAAAEVLADDTLIARAGMALARCLFWLKRYDEGVGVLESAIRSKRDAGAISAELYALLARMRASTGDGRAALDAAARALTHADGQSPRIRAAACRAMARARHAIGDNTQAREWAERALRVATSAHLPLAAIRARCLIAASVSDPADLRTRSMLQRLVRGRYALPALVKDQVEFCCSRDPASDASGGALSSRALSDLGRLLELSHGAPDEQSALDDVCRDVLGELRAATVQVVDVSGAMDTLARTGRPWPGCQALVSRVLARGAPGTGVGGSVPGEPFEVGVPVSFAQQTIAVMCCRWTLGSFVDRDRAVALLRAAALSIATTVRNLQLRPSPPVVTGGWELLGTSEVASTLRAAIERAARAPFPVLIEGESGSGKELVARSIHRLSARRDRRLCTLNCAALSDDLIEAELFGHARGAFTGAVGERAGLFEEADGGTLFLDEVGELSPRAQAKLLRVLQDGEVRRVGENLPKKVDTRIVAATNRRLDEEVVARRFRADLRFRLDVVRIVVPPLRARPSDIPALATHFWTEAAARVGTSAVLIPETLAALARYDWPGNVRELQNVIASLAVHAPRRGRLAPARLPEHIARVHTSGSTFEAARLDFERRFVRAALAQAGGQRLSAARALGVSRQGLSKMLRRLGLEA